MNDAIGAKALLTEFIQEGIGALLAYLPRDVAYNTLSDFLVVLKIGSGEGSAVDRKVEPQVAMLKNDTEKILQRLDAVKKQVEETQAIQNQLLVPIIQVSATAPQNSIKRTP